MFLQIKKKWEYRSNSASWSKDGGDPRNVALFTIQQPEAAASPRIF